MAGTIEVPGTARVAAAGVIAGVRIVFAARVRIFAAGVRRFAAGGWLWVLSIASGTDLSSLGVGTLVRFSFGSILGASVSEMEAVVVAGELVIRMIVEVVA